MAVPDHDYLPPIGITMGCPAGIGPEIILRFWQSRPAHAQPPMVVLGDPRVLANAARQLGLAAPLRTWQAGEAPDPASLNILPVGELSAPPAWGQPTPESGRAMGRCIVEACRLALGGELAALVTCPIGKEMLNAGGYHYPGHTEMLAALCETPEYAMMMAGRRLRVVLATIHCALTEVPAALESAKLHRLLRLTVRALRRDFAIARPRLAVAGLNPHAGEGGMFGHEEKTVIAPAVAAAAAELGADGELVGPRPPDTVFHQAAAGHFDGVLAMYHDQGLIPFKLLHFSDGVNVTLGLPVVRTSVDHGTAYDIAGRGLADPASLAAAFQLATEIVAHRTAAG
ncbi:MAG: 4-hydroxythreonine-4-phosphate dehydrogenase PdxA [Desulfurivibrio sp.]|nr:4-hydroxythreonine-4-phosphate dehydrogenase PdxA [Desulfurivibrio sp.]